jgi:hypothetical protein
VDLHRSVAEDSSFLKCHAVSSAEVTDISKHGFAVSFVVKQPSKTWLLHGLLVLNVKEIKPFENSVIIY